ncbi:glycoside hydrolase family 15 protein, partial [Streptomyces sp. URMC 126]
RLRAYAGPDVVVLDSGADFTVEGGDCTADFSVDEGEKVGFRLAWRGLRHGEPERPDTAGLVRTVAATERWWREWAGHCTYSGEY